MTTILTLLLGAWAGVALTSFFVGLAAFGAPPREGAMKGAAWHAFNCLVWPYFAFLLAVEVVRDLRWS